MTDEVRFFLKKIGRLNLDPTGIKSGPKWGFLSFSWVLDHMFSLGIACNDSLWQYLTPSRGKTHEKNWDSWFVSNGPKSGPKLGFLPFCQVWFISFSLNCIEW